MILSSKSNHGLVRSAATLPGRDVTQNARLFAAVTQASDDALVAVFDAKYHYGWPTIDAFVQEVGNARVYDGVHYRFSTEVGAAMGRQIGALAVARHLRNQDPK